MLDQAMSVVEGTWQLLTLNACKMRMQPEGAHAVDLRAEVHALCADHCQANNRHKYMQFKVV